MLKRLYIDNYKCLVNFEWQPGPGPVNLLLGGNGSGKSTVFEVLDKVRRLFTGKEEVGALFPASSRCAWADSPIQKIVIDWQRKNVGTYRYQLTIEHGKDGARIKDERIELDEKTGLWWYDEHGVVTAGEDDGTPDMPSRFPFRANVSPLGVIAFEEGTHLLLSWFKQTMKNIRVLRLNPPSMTDLSKGESPVPSYGFDNFASWYRWLSSDQGVVARLQDDLTEVIPGFRFFRFESFGPEARQLQVVFGRKESETYIVPFADLSEGQRVLVALHALTASLGMNGGADRAETLLCIDEPDNYLCAREIQPWLILFKERLEESDGEAFLISHHPEIINFELMPRNDERPSAFWFDREEDSHATVRPVGPIEAGGISAAELAARGWLGLP